MKTTDAYPIAAEEAASEINRLYNDQAAWGAGIRTWHSGGAQPIAVTFVESPRTPVPSVLFPTAQTSPIA